MADPAILWHGPSIDVTLNGTVRRGQTIRHNGTNYVTAGTADGYAEFIALGGGRSGDTIRACQQAELEDLDAPFTAGDELWTSATAGDIATTAPTTGVLQVIGHAVSTSKAIINSRVPNRESIEIAGLPLILGNSTNGVSNAALRMRGNNTTRANNDEIYESFYLNDTGGTNAEVARTTAIITDVTAASRDGGYTVKALQAGTLRELQRWQSTAAGALQVVINEDALSVTTRIESLNNANILVIDGGTDSLALGAAVVAGAFFTVSPYAQARTLITSVGGGLHVPAGTLTDNGTARTVAVVAAHVLGTPTFTNATNAVTGSDTATLYIAGAPTAGANWTSTRSWAIGIGGGSIGAAAGTVSLPSYSFLGNANTGMYNVATNQIALAGGGTRIFTTNNGDTDWASGNRVKIGSTATHATASGTNLLSMYTGTAPTGTLASGGSLYVATATNVELNYIDSGGNAQQLSTT